MLENTDIRDWLIILADTLIDRYHLDPAMTLNFEAQVHDRIVKVAITFKEAE